METLKAQVASHFTSITGRPANYSRRQRFPFSSTSLGQKSSLSRWRSPQIVCSSAPDADVLVVGAGLAGLSCAVELKRSGLKAKIIEASDGVGGRVRTDVVDGFLLDRGFQIFLSGYPTAKEMLDYQALDLKPFYAGAQVWCGEGFHRVADPFRHWSDGLQSLGNPVGSVQDKINVGLFRMKCVLGSLEDLLARPETTIFDKLKAEGFSDSIINQFFRPFLGGIFFNRELTTSSRMFEFVMRMLATGENCLPAGGIGALGEQLRSKLDASDLILNTRCEQVVASGNAEGPGLVVRKEDGTQSHMRARRGVVVAVEGPEAQRLLGDRMEGAPSKKTPGVGTCCLYFKASRPPRSEGILYLNGTDKGLVNNCCFPTTVAPSYGPSGQTLVSVSVIGTCPDISDQELVDRVKEEMAVWFGAGEVAGWEHMRTYRIQFAQPDQRPPTDFSRPVALGGGLYVCGDHRDSATFDGALVSGRRAAQAILKDSLVSSPPKMVAAA